MTSNTKNNKKSKYIKIASIILVLVVLIVIIGWRLWPRSIASIIPTSESPLGYVDVYATIIERKDGKQELVHYAVTEFHPPECDEIFEEVMAILDSSAYQTDFRNLVPWHIKLPDLVLKDGSCYSAGINFGWGTNETGYEEISIEVLSNGFVAVRQWKGSNRNPSQKVYHLTNSKLMDSLATYAQENDNRS